MDIEACTTKRSDSWKKEAAELSEIEETLFGPLYLRAVDSQAPNPILGCPYALETIDRCIINNNKHMYDTINDQRWVRYICNRARTLDKWCQQFLDLHSNEDLQVLHLACGLDARNFRVNWGENVRWIDIDQPAVVDLRNRVMSRPEGDYRLRSLSITTEGWFRDIPSDRRTIIICESLTFYIEAAVIKKLLRDLVDYFGTGQLIFDTAGSLTKKHQPEFVKKSSLRARWVVDDARDIERFHPKLKLTGRVRWQEYMGSELPMGQNLPPLFGVWTTALICLKNNSLFKDCIQVLRFAFGDRAASVNSSEFTITSEQEERQSTSTSELAESA